MTFDRILTFLHPGQAISRVLYKTNLSVEHYRDGVLLVRRNLGAGVVTTVGANLWAADAANATATLKLANWHDSGIGTTPPGITDTVMQSPTGNVRVVGTQSSAANVYKTIATLAYGSSYAISEWGLFTASVSGTMFDHRTLSGANIINVVSGDTIQFTYQLTIVPGG